MEVYSLTISFPEIPPKTRNEYICGIERRVVTRFAAGLSGVTEVNCDNQQQPVLSESAD